jgi:hypothetical protein
MGGLLLVVIVGFVTVGLFVNHVGNVLVDEMQDIKKQLNDIACRVN